MNLVGRLGKDPEVKTFGAENKKLVIFSLAVNKKRGDEETTSWFNVKAWGHTAERAANLKKGERVIVEVTEAEEEKWKDKATGQDRSKVVFTAHKCYSLNSNQEWTGPKEEEKKAEPHTFTVPF